MADTLIKGMEMPRDGVYWCEIGIAGDIAIITIHGKDRKSFPLVQLPAGHGDLIDRDALKKRTPIVIDYSAGGFGTDGSIRPVRGYGDRQIDQAPTIVPAEGGTNDV